MWAQVAEVDYPAILAAAWEQHLAPRAEDAPTVVSTFAGCGGSSLGYSMAGYRELLAVEWDNNAVETFMLNFPGVPVYHGDIAKLSVEESLRLTGLEPGQLDVLDGSPPCQGFSTAGKRNMDDDRNQLFREYVRLLRGLRPRVFIMENVSGMVKGKMKLVFAEIMRELKASGYSVSCRLLNAMYFWVPQSRERLIFIGVRDDLGIEPSHPSALASAVSAGVACHGVVNKTFGKVLNGTQRNIWDTIRPGRSGEDYRLGYYMNTVKCAPGRPMPTILKGGGTHLHWDEARTLTIEELKRGGSFPDEFIMTGSFAQQWSRVGNSVPPLFMRAIAGHVRREVLNG